MARKFLWKKFMIRMSLWAIGPIIGGIIGWAISVFYNKPSALIITTALLALAFEMFGWYTWGIREDLIGDFFEER